MATPIEQLDLMRNLAPNWDGYNADAPDPQVLELAKEFVRLLAAFRPADPAAGVFVAPGRTGGVQIEWSDRTFDHEVQIDPDGTWGFLHTNRATGSMTERTCSPTRQVVHPELLRELRDLAAAGTRARRV